MKITPIKTRIVTPPRDDLEEVIRAAISTLAERSIVVVTSKVVSIGQGRCVSIDEVKDKDQLAIDEAEAYVPRDAIPGGYALHTYKNNLLISSSGVDASNGDGFYILWPEKPYDAAEQIRVFLQTTYNVTDVGVIITDSRGLPLRRGAVGVSIGYAGFTPLRDYRGDSDIFGRKIREGQANIVDGLAAAAVVAMGEGSETTPIAVVEGMASDLFMDHGQLSDRPFSSLEVSKEEDKFYPLLAPGLWKKGGADHSSSD
ncbi:MAG: coenzyme F420-0:L-glutamate ligase [Candidatus Paceibacterota bacterium]